MEPVADDGFSPNDEVDEVRWVAPEEACAAAVATTATALLLEEVA